MASAKKYVTSKSAQNWLKEVFSTIDAKRLKRGTALYDEGSLIHFEENERGFKASVQGSRRNPYTVEGVLQLNDVDHQLPDPRKLDVDCTCPDWIDICKHSVCAIIHVATKLDKWSLPQLQETTLSKTRQSRKQQDDFQEMQLQLEQLAKSARSSPHTIETLGDASFWIFKHGMNKAMKDVHQVVKQKIKEKRDHP
jgi:uncharacterized Zn finger protein